MSDGDWVCDTQNYKGWSDVFDCTQPNSWAYFGIAIALTFSILGAAG